MIDLLLPKYASNSKTKLRYLASMTIIFYLRRVICLANLIWNRMVLVLQAVAGEYWKVTVT